ncbi:copper resistance protein NlpE [Dysgonomonas massiliensis]|uniref:copper resistance protein NlpE n=1 Tax=Dysgonomonas massiliensis TaxID=2040292 RepID=UPI000C77C381|nr:copper resistance protein NlpE [Dysgonomonas massiliensis]
MKKILILGLSLALFAACGQTNKQKEGQEAEATTTTEEVAQVTDEHNAKNSLDYFGVYEGVTPCADCEGIKVKVTINKDETFTLHNAYIKNGKEEQPTDFTGKYVWNEAGNAITLEGVKDAPSKFFVAEGRIIILDQEGNKIEGELADKYILTQIETFE